MNVISQEKNMEFSLYGTKPDYFFKDLVEKQIDYAFALKASLTGEDPSWGLIRDRLARETVEEVESHTSSGLTTSHNGQWDQVLSTPEFKAFHAQRIAKLKRNLVNLREKLSETRLQRQRVEEVYQQRYPSLCNASLETLMDCLSGIKNATNNIASAFT